MLSFAIHFPMPGIHRKFLVNLEEFAGGIVDFLNKRKRVFICVNHLEAHLYPSQKIVMRW